MKNKQIKYREVLERSRRNGVLNMHGLRLNLLSEKSVDDNYPFNDTRSLCEDYTCIKIKDLDVFIVTMNKTWYVAGGNFEIRELKIGQSTKESVGYHVTKIEKQVYGTAEKILEEVQELLDAKKQGCKIMELVELSDLIGAIEGYLDTNHKGTTLEDLIKMSSITKRAFENGKR